MSFLTTALELRPIISKSLMLMPAASLLACLYWAVTAESVCYSLILGMNELRIAAVDKRGFIKVVLVRYHWFEYGCNERVDPAEAHPHLW